MTQSTVEKDNNYVLATYSRAPFVLVKGNGMYVTDGEGKQYLDFASGIAVSALGHTHPDVVAAIQEQADQLSHVCNLYLTQPQADLAEALCKSSFADKVFFCNSGAEANEGALKFARKYTTTQHHVEKTEFIAFKGGFHGRTMGALSLTSDEQYRAPFQPLMPTVHHAVFNDLASVEALIGKNTSAIIVEPIQWEEGVVAATDEFMQGLRNLCDQHGALLIIDEVQAGVGRTGKPWGYQNFLVQPDILTSAKALGGGLPIGAVLMTNEVASSIDYGDHGSTFAGGPVACRAALAVLNKVMTPDMQKHIHDMSELIEERIIEMNDPRILSVTGLGLMQGIELTIPARPLVSRGYEQGLLLLTAGGSMLRLLPPYIIEEPHVDEFITKLRAVLA